MTCGGTLLDPAGWRRQLSCLPRGVGPPTQPAPRLARWRHYHRWWRPRVGEARWVVTPSQVDPTPHPSPTSATWRQLLPGPSGGGRLLLVRPFCHFYRYIYLLLKKKKNFKLHTWHWHEPTTSVIIPMRDVRCFGAYRLHRKAGFRASPPLFFFDWWTIQIEVGSKGGIHQICTSLDGDFSTWLSNGDIRFSYFFSSRQVYRTCEPLIIFRENMYSCSNFKLLCSTS